MDQAAGAQDFPQYAGKSRNHPRAGGQPGAVQRVLAAGLLYAVATGSREFAVFFLACVVVAGAYGAWSVNRRIFVVQAMPALAALAALAWG